MEVGHPLVQHRIEGLPDIVRLVPVRRAVFVTVHALLPAPEPREANAVLSWRLLSEVALDFDDLGPVDACRLLGRRTIQRAQSIIPTRIVKCRKIRCCARWIGKVVDVDVVCAFLRRTQEHILRLEASSGAQSSQKIGLLFLIGLLADRLESRNDSSLEGQVERRNVLRLLRDRLLPLCAQLRVRLRSQERGGLGQAWLMRDDLLLFDRRLLHHYLRLLLLSLNGPRLNLKRRLEVVVGLRLLDLSGLASLGSFVLCHGRSWRFVCCFLQSFARLG